MFAALNWWCFSCEVSRLLIVLKVIWVPLKGFDLATNSAGAILLVRVCWSATTTPVVCWWDLLAAWFLWIGDIYWEVGICLCWQLSVIVCCYLLIRIASVVSMLLEFVFAGVAVGLSLFGLFWGSLGLCNGCVHFVFFCIRWFLINDFLGSLIALLGANLVGMRWSGTMQCFSFYW